MQVAVVYCYPNLMPKTYDPMAARFAQTYVDNPPGETDHELYVVVNGGGRLTSRQERLFDPLAPKYVYHSNVGKDVGAFQLCARSIPCDLMVCLGAPVRCNVAGWLDIMVRAVENHGPGLYGVWGFHAPAAHIRTTVFWIPPKIFNAYPIQVDDSRRYHFEHSHESITKWCLKMGFPVLQCTARGVFSLERWHHVEKADCLMLDQHSERLGW